jgi:hypothetical protein
MSVTTFFCGGIMEIPDYYWTDFELIKNTLLDRGSDLTVREIYEGWRDASKCYLGVNWMYVPERAPELRQGVVLHEY